MTSTRIFLALSALFVFLFAPRPAAAQMVNVSGTVTDPHGLLYSNATIQAQLIPTGITPTINGQGVAAYSSGSLDASGHFSMTLADNTVLTPSGTHWQFTVNEGPSNVPIPWGTGPQQFVVTLTVSGSSMDVSSTFSAVAPALTHAFGGPGGCGGGGPFTVPALLYASSTTTCGSAAFNYDPNGSGMEPGGICPALSSFPMIWTAQSVESSCWTAAFFNVQALGSGEGTEVTPLGVSSGVPFGSDLGCTGGGYGLLMQNQLELCKDVSGTNYSWSQSVPAANTYQLTQLGGTAITFSDNGSITVPGGCFISVGNPCGALFGLTTDGILYATSTTNATSITPCSANNGVYNVQYVVTANTPVPPSCNQIGLESRSVTGTTDTVGYTDNNETIEFQGSASAAESLPTPTTLENPYFFTRIENLTTGTGTVVTVTPASPWTVNGGASLALSQNQSCRFGVNPNVSMDWLAVCDPQGQYQATRCADGLSGGLSAMAAGTYTDFSCVNTSSVQWTITGIRCYVDNASSTSTLAAANNAGTALLSSAVTCNNTKTNGGAAGTLAVTTLAPGDAITFTFVADGATNHTNWTVSFLQ